MVHQITLNSSRLSASQSSSFSLLNEIIVILSILQLFLSSVIPPIGSFQVPCELLLIALLLYACSTMRWGWLEVVFCYVFLICIIISIPNCTLEEVLVNTKVIGLGVLSLIYFPRVRHDSKVILPTFLLSLFLLIFNFIFPSGLDAFKSLAISESFNLSRFGGVFLNAHYNAFFFAIILIYFGCKSRLIAISGIVVMYFTYSKFVFSAYIASLFSKIITSRNSFKSYLFWLAFAAGLLIFLGETIGFVRSLITSDFMHDSAKVILMQLFDPAYYKSFINLFPSGRADFSEDALELFQTAIFSHDGSLEIGYFQFAIQAGSILGAFYLIILFQITWYFRVLIGVTLLHNVFIFSPLFIYMITSYSRRIKNSSSSASPLNF